jgi:serine/threonine protein kinase
MEQIKGNGFDQILGNTASDANMESFRESQLSETSLEDLLEQVDEFFRTMHSYCIHGSLKADNVMLSTSGEIYIIDFGDSTLLSETEQITPEQLATNMDDEIKITKQLVTSVYRKVFDTESAALAA